jgi:hypothetical protein
MTFLFPIRRALSLPFGLPLGMDKMEFLHKLAAVVYRDLRCRWRLYDELTRIASIHPTDKGVTFYPFNGYTRHYHRLFNAMRHLPVTILEIGLARKRDRGDPRVTCPSLQLWAEYFPHASIVGFDIDDFSMLHQPRTAIFRGDQGKPEDLLRVVADYPKLDIVIDDGSHASFHQQTSLRTLWPYVASGGIYVIEDLDQQLPELESSLPKSRKTLDLLKDLPALHQLIDKAGEIRFFDSPLRDAVDSMACIVKR